MTQRKLVTCPETGHLEELELERTPLGIVVTGCSRFREGTLACPRECARRMDRRDRETVDDRERVLFVIRSPDDPAAKIATLLAEELARDGLVVELADLDAGAPPPLADYDAVVIGEHLHFGRHDRAIVEYIRDHRDALTEVPGFFYSVGVFAVTNGVTRRTGWQPVSAATFADASSLPRDAVRQFARRISDEVPVALEPSLA